ncbi:hypothetical protein J6590_101824 [Homalodisca vitripennis]|nr:hypothetical protein J6590_101824 [Homalodisca vitripennis]
MILASLDKCVPPGNRPALIGEAGSELAFSSYAHASRGWINFTKFIIFNASRGSSTRNKMIGQKQDKDQDLQG